MKVVVEYFGCNNLFQDINIMKNAVKLAMEVCWNKKRKEIAYKKKDS